MRNKTGDKESSFWQFIRNVHLYDTKGEAMFKAIMIAFSWIGAVYIDTLPCKITIAIAANIFLFSASLIMEYAMRLITTDKIVTRILPGIIVVASGLCAIAAFSELLEKPFYIEWEYIYNITAVMVLIIVVDVVIHIITNDTQKAKIETNLKNVGVNW